MVTGDAIRDAYNSDLASTVDLNWLHQQLSGCTNEVRVVGQTCK